MRPNPSLSHIVDFGLSVSTEWFSISNNGAIDHSEHAPKLRHLVERFVREVPVGEFIHWSTRENT